MRKYGDKWMGSPTLYHNCTAPDGQMRIGMTEDGRHWIEATDPPTRVYHCHYCGEKLERPDVKIEVSRGILQAMTAELWRAHQCLQTGFARNAKGIVANEAERIEGILADD